MLLSSLPESISVFLRVLEAILELLSKTKELADSMSGQDLLPA